MDTTLRNHIISRHPAIDLDGRFLFFGNDKVAQQSICKHLLKDRVALWKEYQDYDRLLELIDMDKVFKFTIVRNPWSRVVSAFHYLQFRRSKNGDGSVIIQRDENFRQFICSRFREQGIEVNGHFHYQYPNAFFNNRQFVDFVGRLEKIGRDWGFISSMARCSPILPRENQSPHKDYQWYYDEECKGIVKAEYATDIELFNYTFDGGV